MTKYTLTPSTLKHMFPYLRGSIIHGLCKSPYTVDDVVSITVEVPPHLPRRTMGDIMRERENIKHMTPTMKGLFKGTPNVTVHGKTITYTAEGETSSHYTFGRRGSSNLTTLEAMWYDMFRGNMCLNLPMRIEKSTHGYPVSEWVG